MWQQFLSQAGRTLRPGFFGGMFLPLVHVLGFFRGNRVGIEFLPFQEREENTGVGFGAVREGWECQAGLRAAGM